MLFSILTLQSLVNQLIFYVFVSKKVFTLSKSLCFCCSPCLSFKAHHPILAPHTEKNIGPTYRQQDWRYWNVRAKVEEALNYISLLTRSWIKGSCGKTWVVQVQRIIYSNPPTVCSRENIYFIKFEIKPDGTRRNHTINEACDPQEKDSYTAHYWLWILNNGFYFGNKCCCLFPNSVLKPFPFLNPTECLVIPVFARSNNATPAPDPLS